MGGRGRLKAKTGSGFAADQKPGDHAPLKLEQFLPYQLKVVASLVSQALSRVYARRYGIGVPEWRVLVTLGQYGVMTGKGDRRAHPHAQDQGVARGRAPGKAPAAVRRANRDDMREAFLSLTAAGRAMYEEVAPHALDFARRLTEILTPERPRGVRSRAEATDRPLGANSSPRSGARRRRRPDE